MADQPDNIIEEVSLILFLLNKERYNKYSSYLSKLNLESETKNFLNGIREYYTDNPTAGTISTEEFLAFFAVKHPILRKRQTYMEFMEKLGSIKINSKVLEENLNNFLEKYFASEIILKLTPLLDGDGFNIIPEVQEMINEFNNIKVRLNKDDKDIFVTADLDELLQEEVYKPGLDWRLDCLNQDIGTLRGGSLGHVFARVDAGKTSFLVSEVTNFCTQLKDDEIILWCNNEEKGSKVKFRLYQGALKRTRDEIKADPLNSEKEFEKMGGNRIRIYDEAILSVEEIDQLCQDYNVKLLIIDQGDKVKFSGSKNYSTVEKLKVLYGMFRELAKKYDMDILTVGQAAASAEGVKYLRTDMMDFSKTGKPGELDYAIGIGKAQTDMEQGRDFLRHLSICKNKMNNGVHGQHAVQFDSMRALYTDA